MTFEERKEQTIITLSKAIDESEQIKNKMIEMIRNVEKSKTADDLDKLCDAFEDYVDNLKFLDTK